MGRPGAYLVVGREENGARPAVERIGDYEEITQVLPEVPRARQAARCMNCGVAFCQSGLVFGGSRQPTGCPLHNPIPETNDLLCHGRLEDAAQRLLMSDPFPEFTSRVCPAPCEAACNLGLADDPVTIHDNERAIADYLAGRAYDQLWGSWADAALVSVVGSGPAGLACAWSLARQGLRVRVYERDDRPGGLLMYGIPSMKLPKDVVERRVCLMREAGIEFKCGVDAAGMADRVLRESACVVLATGARQARRVEVDGASLAGVHLALDYLGESTRSLLDGRPAEIDAAGKDVVVIGGGDTGTDCVATALRQGASSVRQVVRAGKPCETANPGDVWPAPRVTGRPGYGQAEAAALFGEDPRLWSCETLAFSGEEGEVRAVKVRDACGERDLPAQLVIIAKGFVGPEPATLQAFCVPAGCREAQPVIAGGHPVYVAGDARLGPSIVARAMADGLRVADEIAASLLR